MRIATWNVNGIRARQAEVEAFVHEHRPEVLCLQEIKATPDKIPASLQEIDGYHCYWHGSKGYSGVGLLVSRDVADARPSFVHPPFDHETRIVVANLGDLAVGSVYVPNGGKDFQAKMQFLEALEAYARALRTSERKLVLCGDFNVTRADIDVHPRERKAGTIGQRVEEREIFDRVLQQGLSDVARRLDPNNDRLYTWWAPWRNLRHLNIGWRLDYLLASEPIAARATECRTLRETGTSDHAPVIAGFDGF